MLSDLPTPLSQWTSLPGGIEQGGAYPVFAKGFNTNLQSEVARQNAPTSQPLPPVQTAGPGVPTSPAQAVARGPAPSDDRSTWQKDKFGTPITPPGWMPPELRGKPGNESAAQPGAPVSVAPSPAAPQPSGPLVPSAVSGAPKGHLRIADPEGLNTYPGPNETSAPQPGAQASTPKPTEILTDPLTKPVSQASAPLPRPPAAYGYGSAPQQDAPPAIAAPPPAKLPAPEDKGIPDAPFHTASLGPEGDSAPPPAAQQQDTTPPPELPHHDIYGDLAMPDVVLPARRGGKIANAMKIARKHRASGGSGTTTVDPQSKTITPTSILSDSSFPAGGGPISDNQLAELGAFALDMTLPATTSAAAPAAAKTTPTPAPPIENNTVGNSFSILGTQGKPVTDGKYNNTLSEVLGTNSPTGQDVFGFEYPNVPPPQPNPYVGPVSTMSGTYDPGSGGSSTSGYVGSVGATPTGASPTLLSPAPVNYPGSDLTYLPPLVGGGNTHNAPTSTLGSVPNASPHQTPGGNAYLGVKRGGAVKKALKVARSR